MGDFFRDYGTQFVLALAGLATIVSLVIGNYFKDNPRAGFILVGASVALVVLGNGASFYTQYQNVLAANAEKARRLMIREGIGRYIGEGNAIMNRFGVNEVPMPIGDEVGWVGRTEDFLRTNLCESYVTRFHDNSGLAPIQSNEADSVHNSHYATMFHEITRLEEFSHETPSC
jgi:hypothetical protein